MTTKSDAEHPNVALAACYEPRTSIVYNWPAHHTAFPMAMSLFCLIFIAVLTLWLWSKARRILRAYD